MLVMLKDHTDHADLFSAIEQDLFESYGARYRIAVKSSDVEALWSLRKRHLRNDAVALFLVPERLREMTGIEFLSRAMQPYPHSKRVLLAAGEQAEIAWALDDGILHRCLTRPWRPSHERIIPMLAPLLRDWDAFCDPPGEALRVIGHRWSRTCCRLKEFLVRSAVSHRWLDIEKDFEEAYRLMDYTGTTDFHLPLVLFSDGKYLMRATVPKIMKRTNQSKNCEKWSPRESLAHPRCRSRSE